MFELTGLIGIMAVGFTFIAFPHPVRYVINKMVSGQPAGGTRILTKQEFIDVETNETFHVWRGAYGVRVWIASLILKL